MAIQALLTASLVMLPAGLGAESGTELELISTEIEAGEFNAAEVRARALLAETETTFGPDSPEAAEVLEVLVRAISKRRPYAEDDVDLAHRLVRTRRLLYGDSALVVADSLFTISYLLRDRNELPAAAAAAEEAAEIRARILGEDHLETASARVRLASILYREGRYTDAQLLLENALAVYGSQPEPDDLIIANTANGLASTLYQIGDYAAAREHWERALEIRLKNLGPAHPSVAQSLNNIALMHYRETDFVASLATYRQALEIREKSLGPDNPEVGYSLNGIAHCYWETGDFATARSQFERALEIFEASLGHDNQETLLCRMKLAQLMIETGDSTQALATIDELVTAADTTFGPDHHWTGSIHQSRAQALMALGRTEEARIALDRGLEILDGSLGPDHREVAIILGLSAAAAWKAGDRSQALATQRHAIRVFEQAVGEHHPKTARANQRLAGYLLRQGDTAEARALLEPALKDLETVFGPDHPDVGACLVWLSRILSASGDSEAAFAAARRAERIGRRNFALVLEVLAENEALRYAGLRISGLDLMLSMLADGSVTGRDATLSAWDAVIRSRALVLDEMARRHRVTRVEDADLTELRTQLAAARENLVRLVIRGAGDDPADRHREHLEAARGRVEKAERSLAAASTVFRDQQQRAEVGVEEVLAAVPPGAGLAAFTTFSRETLDEDDEGRESYSVFVLPNRDSDPSFVELGDREVLDPLISAWRAHLRRPNDDEALCRSAGMPVRRAAWDPLAPLIARASMLFVIPDGAFSLVNFVALPTAEDRYLVETGPGLHHLTSERDLVSAAASQPSGVGLLALGSPDFDASPTGRSNHQRAGGAFRGALSNCAGFQSIRFEPLPASAKEVDQIAESWSAAIVEPAVGDVVSLTGAGASETAFKSQAAGKRVLHLATHAFFLDGNCPSASRGRRGVGGLAPATIQSNVPAPIGNPLHLSGFALAGANRRTMAAPDQDDGVLTAEEISALDLRGVEWAVLSGCDTGVGVVATGEGVLGLRRAFCIAGVRTVIMSLWPVEDEATRMWMEELYHQRLAEGMSTAEAVQTTTLKMLQDRRDRGDDTHPSSWAAFIAAGEWK